MASRYVVKRRPSLQVTRRNIRACAQEGEGLRRAKNAAASAALLRCFALVDWDSSPIAAFNLRHGCLAAANILV